MIPPDDRGFTLGDGVFETVLADAGRLVWFEAHIARMAAGAAALGLPPPGVAEAERDASSSLIAAGLERARAAVRLTWTAGSGGRGLERPAPLTPRLVVTCAAAPRTAQPLLLAVSSVRRNAGSPTSRHKTLAYLDNVLARREAREAGADEAVMLNSAGEVACAAAANLFWTQGDRLFTPALACGALAGIVRAAVLGAAPTLGLAVEEGAYAEAAMRDADAVFVTNSLIGVRAVVHRGSDGGALVSALADAVEALSRSSR